MPLASRSAYPSGAVATGKGNRPTSCTAWRSMPRRRVRYRPDGVIQLRRRVSELEVISLVSGLMFGVFLVQSILIATLLASPALLVITGGLAAPGLWGAWIARSVRLAPAPVPTAPRPPPPRRAA